MLRRLLLLLPAVAVGIVLWAILTAGWPRPVEVARVLGGPARGSPSASWLIAVQEFDAGRRTPLPNRPLRVSVSAGALQASWSGASDRSGLAEVRVQLGEPLTVDPWVRIEAADTGALLAEGSLAPGEEAWRTGTRRQGGWLPGQQRGELWLRVAPAAGTLAVPFDGELVIEATRGPATGAAAGGLVSGAQPAEGIELVLALTGAERAGSTEQPLRTDTLGRARVAVRPLEHAVLLELRAFAPGASGSARTPLGEWYGALHVTPGALHAALDRQRLWVRSPIPRETAYVSLVDTERRRAGYIVALAPEPDGGASGNVELPADMLVPAPGAELFAMVSSEPDKRSPSAVGWPLRTAPGALPAYTFDAADQLLLDGAQSALERQAGRRLSRRRLAALLLGVVGLAMAGTFAAEVRGRSDAGPVARGADVLALASQRWWLVLALICLLLGVGALTWFGLLQR